MNNSIVEKQSKTEIAPKTSWVIYLHFHSCQIRPCNKTIQFFIVNYYYMLLSFIEIVLFISIETSIWMKLLNLMNFHHIPLPR